MILATSLKFHHLILVPHHQMDQKANILHQRKLSWRHLSITPPHLKTRLKKWISSLSARILYRKILTTSFRVKSSCHQPIYVVTQIITWIRNQTPCVTLHNARPSITTPQDLNRIRPAYLIFRSVTSKSLNPIKILWLDHWMQKHLSHLSQKSKHQS